VELPFTLRSRRRKMLLMLAGSLAFVATGLWLQPDHHSLSGYAVTIFFGLCAVVFCVNLLPNSSYLHVTREGFKLCSMFRSRLVRWPDVGRFGVTRIGMRKMVGWDPLHTVSKLGSANQAICGYAFALPDTYGLKAEELAELLNRIRDSCTVRTS